MKISGMQETSFLDYPRKIATTIFSPGCTYRCPTCYASNLVNNSSKLIEEEEVGDYLKKREKWIDGAVFCGGEPTCQQDLPEFAKKLKSQGLEIKLDTNGSNPQMLKRLIREGLVDYVAMDIKGPRQLYPRLTGVREDYSKNVEECMKILHNSGIVYELRTTFVPLAEGNNLRWMQNSELEEMAKWIEKNSNRNTKYFLQKFVAMPEKEMLDSRFAKENLPDEFKKTPQEILKNAQRIIQPFLSNCQIRGK